MRLVESANVSDSLPVAELQSVLREYPVRLAILFGSRASGTARRTSDTDIAVEFESIDREDSEYNEVFFGLSADVSGELDTDVDLVDVHTLSPAMAEAILERGVVLVGNPAHAEDRLRSIATAPSGDRSARERFDAALGRIDQHLDDTSPVSATDSSHGER